MIIGHKNFIVLFATTQLFFLWLFLQINKKNHLIIFTEMTTSNYILLYYSLFLTSILFFITGYSAYKFYINNAKKTMFPSVTKYLENLSVFIKECNIFLKLITYW
jgi:hypothetical protein